VRSITAPSLWHYRHLYLLVAAGVAVYATPACGLDPADYRPLAEFGRESAQIRARAA